MPSNSSRQRMCFCCSSCAFFCAVKSNQLAVLFQQENCIVDETSLKNMQHLGGYGLYHLLMSNKRNLEGILQKYVSPIESNTQDCTIQATWSTRVSMRHEIGKETTYCIKAYIGTSVGVFDRTKADST